MVSSIKLRLLFYEGLTNKKPHYSDRDVLLYNTLDYPSYSLAAEKMKLAYRSAYSILDKIAYFLNHYLQLGIPARDVYFRKLWYEKCDKNLKLRSKFKESKNLALRGLFWLSKDLYEKSTGFRDSIEPEAKDLAEIRNHIEHKYFKLHEKEWRGPLKKANEFEKSLADTLAYSLYRDDFERKTLKLLKLARAALIYLSISIHIEEQYGAKKRDPRQISIPAYLGKWEDRWKF
jgi:hypothetical protein